MSSPTKKLSSNYDEVWSCPQGIIWTAAEKLDPEKRRCDSCRKVCNEKVHRVFELTRIRNFCSKECYDNA